MHDASAPVPGRAAPEAAMDVCSSLDALLADNRVREQQLKQARQQAESIHKQVASLVERANDFTAALPWEKFEGDWGKLFSDATRNRQLANLLSTCLHAMQETSWGGPRVRIQEENPNSRFVQGLVEIAKSNEASVLRALNQLGEQSGRFQFETLNELRKLPGMLCFAESPHRFLSCFKCLKPLPIVDVGRSCASCRRGYDPTQDVPRTWGQWKQWFILVLAVSSGRIPRVPIDISNDRACVKLVEICRNRAGRMELQLDDYGLLANDYALATGRMPAEVDTTSLEEIVEHFQSADDAAGETEDSTLQTHDVPLDPSAIATGQAYLAHIDSLATSNTTMRELVVGLGSKHAGGVSAESAVTSDGQARKRSTERGQGRAKLIAALTQYHKYANGGCLNLAPIGNNELARLAGVATATAKRFFDAWFDGHGVYCGICRRNTSKLVDTIKSMNGEFVPSREPNYGAAPPAENERD